MKTNRKFASTWGDNTPVHATHEGGAAANLSPEQELRRSVMACLLWEDTFYESGELIADRIIRLAKQLPPFTVAAIARETRSKFNIRHAPLLLLSVLAETGRGNSLVSDAIYDVVQRADEPAELLAIHAKRMGVPPNDMRRKISAQMKKGLGRALLKFDEYQLGKYKGEKNPIKLRDAIRLVHPKPLTPQAGMLLKRAADGELAIPDTWETELSAGKDKRAVFTRLLEEQKLGLLALLRNLRNMDQAGVSDDLVRRELYRVGGDKRVFPMRFLAAGLIVPKWQKDLDAILQRRMQDVDVLPGVTAILVDVSGSMRTTNISTRSELQCLDAAGALAAIAPTAKRRVFAWANRTAEINGEPSLKMVMDMRHACAVLGGGTDMEQGISHAMNVCGHGRDRTTIDRMVVITDEQSMTSPPEIWGCKRAYMVNVAANKNGIQTDKRWVRITGWSDNLWRWIAAYENT